MSETKPRRLAVRPADIVVAGAGYVGLVSAVAIKQAAPELDVLVVDAAPDGVWERDTRASAIAGRRDPHADAPRGMGRDRTRGRADPRDDRDGFAHQRSGAPVFLTFGGEAEPGEPFAHMVPNVALNGALRARAPKRSASRSAPARR